MVSWDSIIKNRIIFFKLVSEVADKQNKWKDIKNKYAEIKWAKRRKFSNAFLKFPQY